MTEDEKDAYIVHLEAQAKEYRSRIVDLEKINEVREAEIERLDYRLASTRAMNRRTYGQS